MSVSSLSAARTMCRASNWAISNLELQKLLYIAQMIAIGRTGGHDPLLVGEFQAWDYGPVQSDVYHRAKAFGEKHVPDVFSIADFAEGRELEIIEEVADTFSDHDAFELVEFTHWPQGAWAAHYIPGVRGIVIPRADILSEYRVRTQ